jgi:hypothetical protein
MPKRRVRTAAQIAASRRNLVAARKAKGRKTIPRTEYGGKTLTLFHRTSPTNAANIAKEGFKPGWRGPSLLRNVYGSTVEKSSIATEYGDAVVRFKANRHGARLSEKFSSGERFYSVKPKAIKKGSIKALQGRKIRRIK